MKSTRKIMAKARKSKKKDVPEKIEYEMSSGNVFKDFGYKNPEEAQTKSDLAFLIRQIIKQKKWTQEIAATFMGIDQPTVSKIIKGQLSGFSIERLMKYLVCLGVGIEIKPIVNEKIAPSIHVVKSSLRKTNH
jgi:predicted XRE-type DNA-binding protein